MSFTTHSAYISLSDTHITNYNIQMENSAGKNMAMDFIIPRTHATELLSSKVVSNANFSRKEENLPIDIKENLAITKCSGETQANLASVITHYVETLNQYSLRNLGMLLVLAFLL